MMCRQGRAKRCKQVTQESLYEKYYSQAQERRPRPRDIRSVITHPLEMEDQALARLRKQCSSEIFCYCLRMVIEGDVIDRLCCVAIIIMMDTISLRRTDKRSRDATERSCDEVFWGRASGEKEWSVLLLRPAARRWETGVVVNPISPSMG